MEATVTGAVRDPQDEARWQSLALLLEALRTPAERDHFARLYRRQAPDECASEDLAMLLDTAAHLWAREEGGTPLHHRAAA